MRHGNVEFTLLHWSLLSQIFLTGLLCAVITLSVCCQSADERWISASREFMFCRCRWKQGDLGRSWSILFSASVVSEVWVFSDVFFMSILIVCSDTAGEFYTIALIDVRSARSDITTKTLVDCDTFSVICGDFRAKKFLKCYFLHSCLDCVLLWVDSRCRTTIEDGFIARIRVIGKKTKPWKASVREKVTFSVLKTGSTQKALSCWADSFVLRKPQNIKLLQEIVSSYFFAVFFVLMLSGDISSC